MPNSIFDAPPLRDEQATYAYVEARIWPSGRVCPHCGVVGRSGALKGKSTRIGVYKCYACRKPFTVKVGTIFEDSHVPMHLWLQAIVMMCGSKKGISSNQLHRTLGVTLRTAWHMSHRIRLAMDDSDSGPLGGADAFLEADETYIGGKEGNKHVGKRGKRGSQGKAAVVALVEREGRVRSFNVSDVTATTVKSVIASTQIARATFAPTKPAAMRKSALNSPAMKLSRIAWTNTFAVTHTQIFGTTTDPSSASMTPRGPRKRSVAQLASGSPTERLVAKLPRNSKPRLAHGAAPYTGPVIS